MSDVTVTLVDPSAELRLHRLTGAFLAGYRNANTRTAYLQQLHRWFVWCTAHQLDPLTVERTHIELYLRWFERQVGSIKHRLPRPVRARCVLPLACADRAARHHPHRCSPPSVA